MSFNDDDVWWQTDAGKRQVDAERWNAIEAEAKRRNATEGPEGGRYLVGGVLVDAWGELIGDNK